MAKDTNDTVTTDNENTVDGKQNVIKRIWNKLDKKDIAVIVALPVVCLPVYFIGKFAYQYYKNKRK